MNNNIRDLDLNEKDGAGWRSGVYVFLSQTCKSKKNVTRQKNELDIGFLELSHANWESMKLERDQIAKNTKNAGQTLSVKIWITRIDK